jgi:hypothetical protein
MAFFRNGSAALLAIGLACGAALAPVAALADGAMAVGRHGEVGISYRFNSPGDAERRALRECGHNDCHIVGHFRHQCAAIATGRGDHWGSASRREQSAADEAAVHNCFGAGGRECTVQVRGCD